MPPGWKHLPHSSTRSTSIPPAGALGPAPCPCCQAGRGRPHNLFPGTAYTLCLHATFLGPPPQGCLSLPDPAAPKATRSTLLPAVTTPTETPGSGTHRELGPAGSPLLPSALRMVLTFCRKGFSTKAGGGQLIPTVRSLLSTSNMMASNWAGAGEESTGACYPVAQS